MEPMAQLPNRWAWLPGAIQQLEHQAPHAPSENRVDFDKDKFNDRQLQLIVNDMAK